MSKNIKTNAMRILDSNKINYEHLELDISEAVDGVSCANMLGLPLESTYKTLVTVSKSKNYYVFVVPVASKLDLKKAASVVGEKNVEMVKSSELLGLTGYVHGGCSPFGMKKVFKTVGHITMLDFDKVVFSGGKIGHFVRVNPLDISKVLKDIQFVDIVEE